MFGLGRAELVVLVLLALFLIGPVRLRRMWERTTAALRARREASRLGPGGAPRSRSDRGFRR